MAKEVMTGEVVALKKIKTEHSKEGVYSCLFLFSCNELFHLQTALRFLCV